MIGFCDGQSRQHAADPTSLNCVRQGCAAGALETAPNPQAAQTRMPVLSSVANSDEVSVHRSASRHTPRRRWNLWPAGIALLLALVALAAMAWPKSNYDGAFYTALTLPTDDSVALHAVGMDFLSRDPENVSSPYRDDLRTHPNHFAQQLPFYAVKPLYIALLSLGWHAGLGWRAGAALSGLSFCALGWTVFAWLRRAYSDGAAAAFTAILMLNPTVLQLVRWTSPDMPAIAIAVAGTFAIVEMQRFALGLVLLLTDLWIRPETILFAGLVLCALLATRHLHWMWACGLSVFAVASDCFIARNGYPYSVLFYHSCIQELTSPADVSLVLTRGMYLGALKHAVQGLSFTNPLLSFPVLACALQCFALRGRSLATAISLAAVSAASLLFLMVPNFESRYFLSTLFFVPALCLLVEVRRAASRSGASRDRTEPNGLRR